MSELAAGVRRARTADGALHFEVHDGPTGAPSVLLSAGLGGAGAFWAPQMRALRAAFRVILYDHRGAGRSTPVLTEPHDVEAMADDILAVIDALKLERAHLVGHAAGGLAALALALKAPARVGKLVVVNAWSKPDPYIARCFEARISLLKNSGRRAYVRAQPIFLYPARWISENTARLAADEAHQFRAMPAKDVVLARIAAVLAFDIDTRLGEIKAPVLVSASADDMLVPVSCSERLAAGLANATLDVVPWGGHAFTVTAPDAFNAKLVSFLKG
jgi:aminoacrylate hydrolase